MCTTSCVSLIAISLPWRQLLLNGAFLSLLLFLFLSPPLSPSRQQHLSTAFLFLSLSSFFLPFLAPDLVLRRPTFPKLRRESRDLVSSVIPDESNKCHGYAHEAFLNAQISKLSWELDVLFPF